VASLCRRCRIRSDVLPALIQHLPTDRKRLGRRPGQMAGRPGERWPSTQLPRSGGAVHHERPVRAELRTCAGGRPAATVAFDSSNGMPIFAALPKHRLWSIEAGLSECFAKGIRSA